MNRITARFADLAAHQRKGLICYITAGDPEPSATVEIMHALVAAGADILELGVPFSDPTADGPVIQAACERALHHGTRLRDVVDLVKTFRRTDNDTPVVLMGYLNPVERMGCEVFADAAAAAGVDGVLTVDMPPEEAQPLVPLLRARALAPVFLVAPNTDDKRLRLICEQADGFVYYVSLKGVTGAALAGSESVAGRVAAIRKATPLPVAVGFGIRDAATATAVAAAADAVVVGSAFVAVIAEHADERTAMLAAIRTRATQLRAAIDATATDAASGNGPQSAGGKRQAGSQ